MDLAPIIIFARPLEDFFLVLGVLLLTVIRQNKLSLIKRQMNIRVFG